VNYSIIIPVLNEEKNLSKLIPEIFNRLETINFELIIVDDNSEDNTSILIKKLKRKNLRYFVRKKDKDLSRACILRF
jgi:glycosyltransferase involved in cell wall biosynthesis